MSFSVTSNDGTRAAFIGSGDPNTITPAIPDPSTLTPACSEAVYFNTLPDTRNPAATTVFVWDGVSAWFARP